MSTQVALLTAPGDIGGEPRKKEARVRGPSVQSGARRGLGRGNGGRVEKDDMRTRTKRPRGLWISTSFAATAPGPFSLLTPPPETFGPGDSKTRGETHK